MGFYICGNQQISQQKASRIQTSKSFADNLPPEEWEDQVGGGIFVLYIHNSVDTHTIFPIITSFLEQIFQETM